jgi:hypothetical protein
MNIYSSDASILVNKSQDCFYDLKVNPAFIGTGPGGISQVLVNSTNTLSLGGNGINIPIEGNVRVSTQAGNAISILSDGLFVGTTSNYDDQDARNAFSGLSPIIVNNDTGQISIGMASSLSTGALTQSDWTLFNNKANTAINLGSGVDVFKQKNGVNLEFRRISNGTGMNIVQSGDSIVINSTITQYSNANARSAISGLSPIDYNQTTGVISIHQANATSSGYLSSTDWSSFDSRVPSTRTIITTGPLTGGGALSTNLSLGITKATLAVDGYLSKEDFTTFNQKQDAIAWQDVSVGSSKISLGGDPFGSVHSAFSIDVVENQLNRANFTGTTPITGGGTGADNALQAIINLLPSMAGQGGKLLGTDGSVPQWVTGGGGGGGENPLTFSPPLIRVGDNIAIPVATGSADGYLSASNWTQFDAKVGNAINLGSTGASVFSGKVGTNLEFRRLLAGTNVTLSEQINGIVINAQASSTAADDPWNALSIVEFGGVPNDSSTTVQNANVTAWNNMIAAAGDTQLVIIPDGTWYFNSQLIATTILVPENTSSLNNTRRFNIKVIGNITFTNPSSCGFILEGNYHRWDSSSSHITSTQTGSLSTFLGDGLYVKNCDKAWVEFNRITAFKNGLVVGGESTGIVRGAQYNIVKGLQIRGCETNLLLTTRGTSTIAPPGGNNNGNWCNANIFYIAEIGGGTNPATGGTYGIRIQKDASSNQGDPFNGNFFFGTSLEGVVNGIWWEFAHFNSIIGMRFEGGAITNEIYMREDASTGVECRRNVIMGSTIYEHYFVPGGKGVGTVINGPFLDTTNSNPIGEVSLSGFTTGTFLGITGDETSGNLAGGHSSLAFGGFVNGGSVWDKRFFARMKKVMATETYTRSVDFSDLSATNVASTYTSWPSDINILFNNYTAGIGSVTLPTASGLQLDRKIYIKNLSTTALNVNGLAAGETPTQIPAKGSMMVVCNGTGWYITSGSAAVSGGDVSSIENNTATDNQIVLFNGTTGKSIKKSTGTGYVKTSNGVPSFITTIPVGDISATGTPSSTTYLRGDGTWATISGTGTYTFSTGLSESSGIVTNNLVTGIAGDQTVTGSITSGGDLILRSTTSSTKGQVVVQDTLQIRANTTSSNTAPLKWTKPSSTLPNLMNIQEDGAWEWDGTDWWATNLTHGRVKIITAATNAVLTNVTYAGAPITYNYGGRDTWEDGVPSVTALSGAGTAPTITFPSSNRNGWGKITVTAGTSPSAASPILRVNFSTGISNAVIVFSSGNGNSATRTTSTYVDAFGNTGFEIYATTALSAGQTYVWFYQVKRTQVVT